MALVLSHYDVTGQQGPLGALVFVLAGFYRNDGVTGLCPLKPTPVFIFTLLRKPYFVPV